MAPGDQYILAVYFTVTTITTVGFGDMSASTTGERIFCIILEIFGVIVFTYISGSLSSIMSSSDSSNAILQENMLFLSKLSNQAKLPPRLYNEIRQALKYDNKTNIEGLDQFIQSLPQHLKMSVTLAVNRKTFRNHPFLSKIKNKRMLAFMGSRFHPYYNHAGTTVYRQGDEISSLIIVTKGMAAFVMPQYANSIFACINPKTASH
jgi:hypothetical protein